MSKGKIAFYVWKSTRKHPSSSDYEVKLMRMTSASPIKFEDDARNLARFLIGVLPEATLDTVLGAIVRATSGRGGDIRRAKDALWELAEMRKPSDAFGSTDE